MFYTSNVEQYLFRDYAWQRFYNNVGALPTDEQSTFIRAYFNNQGRVLFRAPNGGPADPQSGVVPIPPGFAPSPGPGPRSETLLNPISRLLAAFAEGRVENYQDVIEISR